MATKSCIAAFLAVSLGGPAAIGGGSIRYVDDDAPPGGDGLAWNTAYQFLQDAMAEAATPGSGIADIRIGQGLYLPDRTARNPRGSSDRTVAFALQNDLIISGGYAGIGEPDPDARDIALYETVLTGDLAGDDVGTLNNAENSIHVLTATDLNATAVLDGVTVRSGHADEFSDKGTAAGGLLLLDSDVIVQSCRFVLNVAVDTGGAVAMDGGSPTFTDCVFEMNEGEFGGAVLNFEGNPSFMGCSFNQNMAMDRGGGLYNFHGDTISLENCSFVGNTAGVDGGGLYNDTAAAPTLTGCDFDLNMALLGSGGGIQNFTSSPTLDMCTFTTNTALFGGGISNAILSHPVLTNCQFESNEASWGGGISNQGFFDGTPGAGSSPTVTDCTFTTNHATTTGGGIASDVDSSPSITGSTFTQNTAASAGGAVAGTLRSDTTIDNCTFTGNMAAKGGAFSCNLDCAAVLTNSTFQNNEAASEGGALHMQDSNPTVQDCTITSNTAGELGGGLLSRRNTLLVEDCSFVDNTAAFGGGALNLGLGVESYVRCTFDANDATETGGAVFSQGTTTTLVNSVVIGNTAAVDGGGLVSTAGDMTVVNSTLSGNEAVEKGGGLFVALGSAALINTTISHNVAGTDGGGVYNNEPGLLTVTNTILWGNSDAQGQIETSQLHGWPGVVNYSCLQGLTGGIGGAGNIGVDPMFVDAAGVDGKAGTADDDVRLLAGSPCIDAGDNLALPPDVFDLDDDGDTGEPVPFDQDGAERKIDDPDTADTGNGAAPLVDIGAFEFPAEQEPVCLPDLNEDGIIGPGDLAIILGNWGPVPPNDPIADLSGDGVVGPADLAIILGNWGPCP